MFKKLLSLVLVLFAAQSYAQNLWRDISETEMPAAAERQAQLQRYRSVQVDPTALQAILEAAPNRYAVNAEKSQPAELSIPLPDGSQARFQVMEASVMAPALQARYPQIRSYTGLSPDDPTALLKCDWTPQGFHAMLHSLRWGTVFIEPHNQAADATIYLVYDKKDYLPPTDKQVFSCGLESEELPPGKVTDLPLANWSEAGNDGFMRKYRLALACTGEYANFHGGTKPLVLAAMVTSINRINSVYERELAVTLELVANNDTLIFLNASSDPYANNNGNSMLGQNVTTCNNLIGAANYDMGHVFSTGGGGIAGLGVICTSGKARGVTGQSAPIGDPFDIDYVAHEMGHQFGANHTQNNSCSRNSATAMEPGSASTIMGYAGICSPNVQNHSDDYFHGVSIAEIVNYIQNDDGNTCPVRIPTGNLAPTVNAGLNYVIPKSTPFVLKAEGVDPDPDDRLSYCWEQMDNQTAIMPPLPTSTAGPAFRSFNPDTLPWRYFPRLTDLVLNASSTWERLPAVGRTLKFRVTVRDNNPAGGATAQDNMSISVSANAGPFRLTQAPNAPATWRSGEYQVITWDVANTDQAPIFCAAVNIRLSIDGGYTYPYLLAAAVPNNGKACVRLPELETQQSRILIEAVNNVFFDISDKNVAINLPTIPSFSMCIPEPVSQVCLPNIHTIAVSTIALAGLSEPIELFVSGLPPGVQAQFSPNPVLPGEISQLVINFPGGLAEGNVDLQVEGIAGADTVSLTTSLNLVSNDFTSLELLGPSNGASGLDLSPVLYWQRPVDANTVDLQLATTPVFDPASLLVDKENIVEDSLKVPVVLEKGMVYYWRVRPANECGLGPWIGPFAFATLTNICLQSVADDVPLAITASQVTTVESKIKIPVNSIVSDVNITRLQGNHEFFKDLEAHLISPAGTEVLLFTDKCGGFNGNFRVGFDDNAATELTCQPPNNGSVFRAAALLSQFNGENSAGDWVLRIRDREVSSGGNLTGFDLEICSNSVLFGPSITVNNPLFITPGTNAPIGTDLLKSEDADNTDSELIYTLTSLPQHGQLQLYWTGELPVGAQFSQADLNSLGLRYFNYGGTANTDQFCFTVTDGQGGLAQGCFAVELAPVGTSEQSRALEFILAPNPAAETVQLIFSTPLPTETRIRLFDAAGRLAYTAVLPAGQETSWLQLAQLPGGLYTLALDNARGTVVRKLALRGK